MFKMEEAKIECCTKKDENQRVNNTIANCCMNLGLLIHALTGVMHRYINCAVLVLYIICT